MKFKVGDQVTCINPNYGLKKDTIYIVKSYQSAPNDDEILLEDTSGGSFYESRFVLSHIQEFQDKLEELLK